MSATIRNSEQSIARFAKRKALVDSFVIIILSVGVSVVLNWQSFVFAIAAMILAARLIPLYDILKRPKEYRQDISMTEKEVVIKFRNGTKTIRINEIKSMKFSMGYLIIKNNGWELASSMTPIIGIDNEQVRSFIRCFKTLRLA